MPMQNDMRKDQDASARHTLSFSNFMMILLCLIVGAGLYLSKRGHVSSANSHPVVSVKDGRGRIVQLNKYPSRIVSIAPAETEILFAIGAGNRVVADTTWCDWPPAARSLPKIGDMNTSVEKVVAQRPDVVVGSISANGPAIQSIEGAGIPVFAVDPQTVSQTYQAIQQIGLLTGNERQADAVVEHMRKQFAYVQRRLEKAKSKPRVLCILQPSPLWVVGSDNFIDDLIRLAGGVNVASADGKGFISLSPETAIASNPDIIITSPDNRRAILSSPILRKLHAVRAGKVFCPNADLISRAGPRMGETVMILAHFLHPRLFSVK